MERLKSKSTIIILIVCICTSIILLYLNLNISEESILASLRNTKELTARQEKNIEKYLAKIAEDKEEGASKITNFIRDEEINKNIKKIFLENIGEEEKSQIDYKELMDIYIDEGNKEIEDEVQRILLLNSKMDNEKNFINICNSRGLIKDYDKFMTIFKEYDEKSIGTKEEIYKLDIDTKIFTEKYLNGDIEKGVYTLFIRNKDLNEISNNFIERIKSLIENKQYDSVKIVQSKIEKLDVEIKEHSKGTLKELYDICDNINEYKKEKDNIKKAEDELSSYRNRKKEAESQLEELNNGIQSLRYDISYYESEIYNYEPFLLEGYIIADLGQEYTSKGAAYAYECAHIVYNYYGETTSEERYLLYTYNTTFHSKGRFSLNVMRNGTESVTIKEELGGFTQQWDVYEEYFQGHIDLKANLQAFLDDIVKQLDKANGEYEQLSKTLEELSSLEKEQSLKVQESKDKINIIVNTIKEKQNKLGININEDFDI